MKVMLSRLLAVILLLSVTACGRSPSATGSDDESAGAKTDTQSAGPGNPAAGDTENKPSPENDGPKAIGKKIAYIPKVSDEAYWIAVESGAKTAAEAQGAELLIYSDSADKASAANQAAYIQTAIDEGADAIVFAALDSEAADTALQSAQAAGITVVGFDSDPGEEARDWFVNQVDPDELASVLLTELETYIGDKYTQEAPAKVALVSTTPNTPNQNTWIESIKRAYYTDYNIALTESGAIDFEKCKENTRKNTYTVRDKYNLLDVELIPENIIYAGNGTGLNEITAYLTAHPDTNALITLTTNAVPSCGAAIESRGLKGSCVFGGIAAPTESKPYLENGTMTSVVLWQAYDLGSLAIEIACAAVTGTLKKDESEYSSSLSYQNQVEGVSIYPNSHLIDGSTIYLGGPATFTLDSLDKWKT